MRFEQLPFSPELVEARWVLGKLPSEELPRLAQDALELGFDGMYTRRIAGLVQPDAFDVQPFMTGFFAELGIRTTALSQEQAALVLAKVVAQRITDGNVPPYEGARFIWKGIVSEMYPNNPPEELLSFVGLASEYEDCEFYSVHPEEVRRKIERDIVQTASEFAKKERNCD